jgi:hypothetical protein
VGLDNDPDSREYDGDEDDDDEIPEADPQLMADGAMSSLKMLAATRLLLPLDDSSSLGSYTIGGNGAAGSCGPPSPPVESLSAGLHQPEKIGYKPPPVAKLYARRPLRHEPDSFQIWFEVDEITKVPVDWEIKSATSAQDLCDQVNAARGGTKEQQYAATHQYGNYSGMDGSAQGIRMPGYQQVTVREWSIPRFTGNDLDMFLQLVRRDGRMQLTPEVQAECQRRLQEEGRKYTEHYNWSFIRYLNELSYFVEVIEYGAKHYIRHNPEKARWQAADEDAKHNPTIRAQIAAAKKAVAGLQMGHVQDFVYAMANEMLAVTGLGQGCYSFRDPREGTDGASRGKEAWALWLRHYVVMHNAVIGPDQFRTMITYKTMVEQWKAAPKASLKTWEKIPEVIAWMQQQVRLRTKPPKRKDISRVSRSLYKFNRGK